MLIFDNYLRFIVYELKPFVDSRYRTRPEREFTFLMGSSMGGLISLYAICEYPQVFSGAGCLSTHWPIAPKTFSAFLKTQLPRPGQHKIYLDYGSEANKAILKLVSFVNFLGMCNNQRPPAELGG